MAEDEENIEEVYDDNAREDLVDNDEISPEEEAFMAGYEDRREKAKGDLEGDEAYEKAFEEPGSKEKKEKPKMAKKPVAKPKPSKGAKPAKAQKRSQKQAKKKR